MEEDSLKVAKRRAREAQTVSQMIALYCACHHAKEVRCTQGHCGEPLCDECAKLDAYAVLRTQRCRKMDVKTSCDECENHCYRPEERARIREVMRYAGPRMITKHPVAALRHLLGK